jgi:hypothetical protein
MHFGIKIQILASGLSGMDRITPPKMEVANYAWLLTDSWFVAIQDVDLHISTSCCDTACDADGHQDAVWRTRIGSGQGDDCDALLLQLQSLRVAAIASAVYSWLSQSPLSPASRLLLGAAVRLVHRTLQVGGVVDLDT